MANSILRSSVLLCALTLTSKLNASPVRELPKNLESTVKNYLAANASYREGDLITESQLGEIQTYLRRTHGHSLATHRRWRKRVLPDSAPLVRIFYSKGGAILNKLATQNGGYAELDFQSRNAVGRKKLQEAVRDQSPERLKKLGKWLADEKAKRLAESDSDAETKANMPLERIYTAQDFMAALKASQARKSAGSGTKEPLLKL